jgi:hypothetical protein
MRIGRGNRSTRRKPAPMPLCPPQIPHDLGSNPGRRGGKPATNRLSYGTAVINMWHHMQQKSTNRRPRTIMRVVLSWQVASICSRSRPTDDLEPLWGSSFPGRLHNLPLQCAACAHASLMYRLSGQTSQTIVDFSTDFCVM